MIHSNRLNCCGRITNYQQAAVRLEPVQLKRCQRGEAEISQFLQLIEANSRSLTKLTLKKCLIGAFPQ